MGITKTNNKFYSTPKLDPKDKIEVEVGDSKQIDFHPQFKIMRWDNEVNFSARLVTDKKLIPTLDGDKVKWKDAEIEASFYDLAEMDGDGGGFEFEITLNSKPSKNTIDFTIEDKDIEYLYQPPLTQEQIDSGWEQPEKVMGSYAVYATGQKTNFVGGKEYKCGKVGHIYRPKIVDSAGNETWGVLEIDSKKKILTVTIDKTWLKNAVYPVHHTAGLTFGYTTQGGGVFEYAAATLLWNRAYSDPAASGTLNSITVYCKGYGEAFNPAIYSNAGDNTPGSRLAYMDSGGTTLSLGYGWNTTNLSYAGITSGAKYWLGQMVVARIKGYYDAGHTNDMRTKTGSAWPDPASDDTAQSLHYSIYATYTESASSAGNVIIWS